MITGNVANSLGGGLVILGNGNDVRNGVISGNRSTTASGGGIYTTNRIFSCLIAENTAKGNGGGIYAATTRGTFINCTIVRNIADGVGGWLASGWHGIRNEQHCLLQHGRSRRREFHQHGGQLRAGRSRATPAVAGVSNITSVPVFANASAGNYRLRPHSPCYNKGRTLGWMSSALDLDGNDRVLYALVDMGCYECPDQVRGTAVLIR